MKDEALHSYDPWFPLPRYKHLVREAFHSYRTHRSCNKISRLIGPAEA